MATAPDAVSTASEQDAASEPAAPATLRALLQGEASAADITRHLDALDPAARLAEVLAVKGKWVKALYDRMADGPVLSLEEFVPRATAGATLIYEGRNSLAMFTRFQKRFLRLPSGVIVGYNHQSMQWITGPGYFVMQAPDGQPPVPGEPYVDYITEPPEVPEGWPAYKSNNRGLSKSVYANMHDYLRRVATGVVVGKAYRAGEDIGAHFSLTLQPPTPPEQAA
jgi:hypothetical protein